ncbi:MAG: hypothetical protein OXH73_13140 [Caldilineaceae bacterium]|nr:hypothetical protein [Caldilineaceae bacterium]
MTWTLALCIRNRSRLITHLPAPTPKARKNREDLLMMDIDEESLDADDTYDAFRYAIKSCRSGRSAFA